VTEWKTDALEPALRGVAESKGLGAGKLFAPLRVALTGQSASPGIFEVLEVLGRERSLERINDAVRHITENR
jgi:glutamyl-tRNA synthetase